MAQLVVKTRDGRTMPIETETGRSVMQTILDHGIQEIAALCGGACACATCHVYVAEADLEKFPPAAALELELLDALIYRRANSRLACQIAMPRSSTAVRIVIGPEE